MSGQDFHSSSSGARNRHHHHNDPNDRADYAEYGASRPHNTMHASTDTVIDTSHLSNEKKENMIINKRGSFVYLPVWHDWERGPINDLEVGSWYFVWGSLMWMLFPILPLIDLYYPLFPANEDADDTPLPIAESDANYALVMLSGLLFTIGSIFFVRCFWEPSPEPYFTYLQGSWLHEHVESDELVGAWFFFLGSIPALPFSIIYIVFEPESFENWGTLFISLIVVVGTYLFVLACYPSIRDCEGSQVCPQYMAYCFGKDHPILYHVQNNWIAGCWLFYWGSVIGAVAAAIIFVMKWYARNYFEMYTFFITFVDSLLFGIGSAYYVAGSYPMNNKAIDEALSDAEDKDKLEEGDSVIVVNGSTHVTSTA